MSGRLGRERPSLGASGIAETSAELYGRDREAVPMTSGPVSRTVPSWATIRRPRGCACGV